MFVFSRGRARGKERCAIIGRGIFQPVVAVSAERRVVAEKRRCQQQRAGEAIGTLAEMRR